MVTLQEVESGRALIRERFVVTRPGDVRLDSADRSGTWSQWSYVAEAPVLLLRAASDGSEATLSDNRGPIRTWKDPLDALRWMEAFNRCPAQDGPPFKGGWIGFLSYDLGRVFEVTSALARDDLHAPLFQFTYHPRVWCLHNGTGTVLCAHAEAGVDDPLPQALPRARSDGQIVRTFTRAAYLDKVERAIEYIRAGDIFQVNLAQRFTAPLRSSPERTYDVLRSKTPACFGAYLGWEDMALLSNSPELFLRVTPSRCGAGRSIVTRPIKGTRPLLPGADLQLLNSEKDKAELHMIVDLERNDLGRVCTMGSVRVVEPRVIERHPTLYHGVSTIQGTLRDDVDLVDLLRATFPGGSITGAPKIRAMQIIDELEPVRRGPYCGAIGYVSVDGHIQFNIAIRTMIVTHSGVHISVGGGIVADSQPQAEYDETIVKAKAMFNALGMSQRDLLEES